MPDYTAKRIDDMEAIFGGGFRKARSELGVTSFGMQVLDFPPNADQYPEHLVEKMKEIGLFGCLVPEEYGGLDLDALTYARMIEELSAGWMSYRPQIWLPPPPGSRESTGAVTQ